MKRLTVICILIILPIVLVGLNQSTMDPSVFSGQWYSSMDQNVYTFQEGLIYCAKHTIPISDKDAISGAYVYAKDSIVLFAAGIEGLETEKELYLIHKDEGSFLCENKNGSGKIYFIRHNE